MRKYLLVVSSVLVLGIPLGCSSKPKFTGCVGNNDCRPQEMNFTPTMTGNSAFTVSKIDIQANEMVWNPTSQRIDLSVVGSNGANGNTITALNPLTGQLSVSEDAGSGADMLALSSEGSYLNAGIDGAALHYDNTTGYVYSDGGQVVDPSTGTLVGTFAVSGVMLPNDVLIMVPDGTLGLAYFLGQTQAQKNTPNRTIEAFDLTQLTPIGSITINNVIGAPVKLIRWGANGLAFLTQTRNASTGSLGPAQGDGVYLISGPFVTHPAAQARVASLSR